MAVTKMYHGLSSNRPAAKAYCPGCYTMTQLILRASPETLPVNQGPNVIKLFVSIIY
jgi:hypothetical protein